MKVAIVTDTHFGVRGDDHTFHDYFEKFYSETFFPTLKERGIKQIIHTGDVVDRRKFINYVTANKMKNMFFEPAAAAGIRIAIAVGNHDCHYKNTNAINSMNELCKDDKNVDVYSEPTEVKFGNIPVLMMPWINSENSERAMNLIANSKAKILLGHLEIIGFEMYPGFVNEEGLTSDIFENFEFVGSGHLHHKSSKDNIHYFGSPYETTWSDYKDPRGFHILDLETQELEFIENPNRMFYKLFYDDAKDVLNINFKPYTDKIVKVIVIDRKDPILFDKFIDKLEKVGPIDVQVVEDHLNAMRQSSEDILDTTEDTLTIVDKYITSVDIPDTQQKAIKKLFVELYNEAITL